MSLIQCAALPQSIQSVLCMLSHQEHAILLLLLTVAAAIAAGAAADRAIPATSSAANPCPAVPCHAMLQVTRI